MAYENIIVETRGAVGLITLNRPKAMNALNAALMAELAGALDAFEDDDAVAAIVIAGSEKAFAAGADIKEMKDKSFMDAFLADFLTRGWERTASCRKPTIAAVAGYALGGGCELAMMCDIIIAADNAQFGQPEEAERSGLVTRIVPVGDLLDDALKTAEKIARMSRPLAMITKEAVNRAFEVPLAEGLRFERRMFHAIFATDDQKEGMGAFVEKRKPAFKNR
jgi:enoyl-CoA hydratase